MTTAELARILNLPEDHLTELGAVDEKTPDGPVVRLDWPSFSRRITLSPTGNLTIRTSAGKREIVEKKVGKGDPSNVLVVPSEIYWIVASLAWQGTIRIVPPQLLADYKPDPAERTWFLIDDATTDRWRSITTNLAASAMIDGVFARILESTLLGSPSFIDILHNISISQLREAFQRETKISAKEKPYSWLSDARRNLESDAQIAEELVRLHGANLIYHGGYWFLRVPPSPHFQINNGEVYRYVLAIASYQTKKMNASAYRVRSILDFASAFHKRDSINDGPPHHLPVANGVVDLRTGELLETSDDCYTFFSPIAYDPEVPPGLWAEHLEKIFPDEDARRDFQLVLGYTLYRKNPERIFPICYGSGRNGKSVTLRAISSVLGPLSTHLPISWFMGRHTGGGMPDPFIMRLRHARLAVITEAKRTEKVDVALIKLITGGDTISARGLFQNEISEFIPDATPLVLSNSLPNFDDDSHATWDRLRILPFTVRIAESEEDTRIIEKLATAKTKQEILRWLVEGAVRYAKEGMIPPRRLEFSLRVESDPVFAFLESGGLKDIPKGGIKASDAYSIFKQWMLDRGYADPLIPGRRRFYSSLADKGWEREMSANSILYLKPPRQ